MKFRIFIMMTELTIVTDHKALTFLMQSRLLSGRLTRWILLIQEFKFKIVHCAGKDNKVADALSRFPRREDGQIITPPTNGRDVVVAPIIQCVSPELRKRMKEIDKLQREDERFGKIIKMFETGKEDEVKANYTISNRQLFWREAEGKTWKICLPKQLENEVIDSVHVGSGHIGPMKCVLAVKEYFYFKRIAKSIRQRVGACDICQRTKHPNRIEHGTFAPIIPTQKGELVATDIFGPLPKGLRGCRYVLVFMDVFSKLDTLYPIVKQTAAAVTNKVKLYMANIQKPKAILSDHGTQYTSHEWNETLENEGVKAYMSSIRHPQSNPAERLMREIGRLLRVYCSGNHAGWVKWIDQIEDWLNSVHHESTGYTASELHFNKKFKPTVASCCKYPQEGVVEINREVKIEIAKQRLVTKSEARKLRHENKYPHKTVFQVGDQVLLKSLHVSDLSAKECRKLFNIYEGPYNVIAIAGKNAYELTNERGASKGVFNVVNLKPYRTL